jgi:hypothetical protein
MTIVSFAKRHLGLPKKLALLLAMANWSQDAASRLGDAVKSRRARLGRTQLEIWQAGGPANSTLTSIESGRQTVISTATLRKLDKGLSWEPGTAARILNGEPVNPISTPLENMPTEKVAEIASEALSELRRRIRHVPVDDFEGDSWGGLDPRGHWPEDDEQSHNFRKG